MKNQIDIEGYGLKELSFADSTKISGGTIWGDIGDAIGTGLAYVYMGAKAFYSGAVYAHETMPGLK